MNENAQLRFGFLGLVAFFIILTLVSAQEIEGNPTELPSDGTQSPPEGPIVLPEPEIPPEDIFPSVAIISPVENDTISKTGLVIVSVNPQDQITSAFFEIGGTNQPLLAENKFSGEFDSALLQDGEYEFKATACIKDNCTTSATNVKIENAEADEPPEEEPQEEPAEEPTATEYSVKGSNLFSAMTIFNQDGSIAGSGSDYVKIKEGIYNFQIDFFEITTGTETALKSIFITSGIIKEDGLIVEADNEIPPDAANLPNETLLSEQGYSTIQKTPSEWIALFAIKTNPGFESEKIVLVPPAGAELLFKCPDWSFPEKKCNTLFEEISKTDTAEITIDAKEPSIALGFLAVDQNTPLPDFNSIFDENKPLPVIKKFGKKTMRLEKKQANFAANDLPSIDAFVSALEETSGLEEGVDAQIEASLTMPDGTIIPLPAEQVQKKEAGKFSVKAFWPRSFKPGTYSITIRATDGNETVEQTESFEWGLIAVNTMKSTYRPGETAEFQIVVLDRESFGVNGAEVNLGIVFPSGKTTVLSTENDTVIETTTAGVYAAKLGLEEEGTYNVHAKAVAPQIDTFIETTFLVSSSYDFDIIRATATKIDPKVQPINVELTISPFQSTAQKVTVREFVPKEFEVILEDQIQTDETGQELVVPDPRISVTENENEKIIEWKNVEFDTENNAFLKYKYKVPDKKPWLYLLGPVEIKYPEKEMTPVFPEPIELPQTENTPTPDEAIQNTFISQETIQNQPALEENPPQSPQRLPIADVLFEKTFTEARSWMVAVDANPTSIFYFRNADTDNNAVVEPRPNDANCGTGCNISGYVGSITQDFNNSSDIVGANTASRVIATGTTKGVLKFKSFITRPLVTQTITASGTWGAGIACTMAATTNNTSRPAYVIYRWIAATDSNGERITNFFYAGTGNGNRCPVTTAAMRDGSASGIYSSVTFNRGDKLVVETDINVSAANAVTTQTLTAQFNGNSSGNDGNMTLPSGVTLRIAGDLNTGIVLPANNATKTANTEFDVNALGSCKSGYSCGDTNVTLQYCIAPDTGCNNWTFYDMNTSSSSPLYISTGAASRKDSLLDPYDTNWFVFGVTGTQATEYLIRSKIDSNWSTDINYSNLNLADVNVTISAANDYTFTLSLPSTGCFEGQGSVNADTSCDKAYFETTDISGNSDENKVNAQGQNSVIPFFVYDNQSTSSSDLNITLDLNASLPASLLLKVSKIFAGWAGSCTGNTDNNCLSVTTTAANAGKATYSTGSQDLNIFVWGDFVSAGAGSTDRNARSTSVAP